MKEINIGDFYVAKLKQTYFLDGVKHYNDFYKCRPVLIIGKHGKFYKCLSTTTQLRNNLERQNRIDVYTNYNFDKHSQIVCGYEFLITEENMLQFISHCCAEDFAFVLQKNEYVKENNLAEMR